MKKPMAVIDTPVLSLEERYVKISELNISLLDRNSKLLKEVSDCKKVEVILKDNEVLKARNDTLWKFKVRIMSMNLKERLEFFITGRC